MCPALRKRNEFAFYGAESEKDTFEVDLSGRAVFELRVIS